MLIENAFVTYNIIHPSFVGSSPSALINNTIPQKSQPEIANGSQNHPKLREIG